MVKNVSLRDSVGSVSANPAHDATTIAEDVTVQSGQSTTRESELRSAIVGEERIGMLQECDQDEPMVDPNKVSVSVNGDSHEVNLPQVRDEVESEDFGETFVVDPCRDACQPQ
jgi:hypothetical protein